MTDTVPAAVVPAEDVGRFPLSLQLDFLRMMDRGGDGGPFSPRFTVVAGWRVFGTIDLEALRLAGYDVVSRHETLRSRFVFDDGEPYQRILPADTPELDVRDLAGADRDRAAEEFLNEIEATEGIAIEDVPGLRMFLGRFDAQDAVLVVAAHHTAVDGYSVALLGRDLTACYAARREDLVPELPPIRQYRDFVAWQRERMASPESAAARDYWREQLRDARMTPFPTDHPRPDGTFVTGWHRGMLDAGLEPATLALARSTHTSPFMVMMAAFAMQAREWTGESDLVIPTFLTGRHPAWTQDVIGTFYNFTPLRTRIADGDGFLDVLAAVRTACLAAYRHELTFPEIMGEAPELMASVLAPNAAPIVFQVIQTPFMRGTDQVGDLRFAAVRKRTLSSPIGSQIPDGMLVAMELHPGGGIGSKVGYTELFEAGTVNGMVDEFARVLRANVTG